MTILVLGASGSTGRRVVEIAGKRSHKVIAFVRDTSDIAGLDVPIIRGDATSRSDVDAAIGRGFDAVVSALGARSLKKTRLLEIAMGNVVTAMQQSGTSRLIELGAAGTFGLPRVPGILIGERITFAIVRRTLLRNSFDDHAAADQLIQKSNLDWTIVQPPELSDGPSRGYSIALDGLHRGGAISRDDVAFAIVDVLDGRTYIRQSPFVFRAASV
jgi:putative NADH-flavin reductase